MHELQRSFEGLRVLAVDDSEQITSILAGIFGQWGADCTALTNGHQALDLLHRRRFDLILLDLIMPHPNGWEICRDLRDNRPDQLRRVLLLTGDMRLPGTEVGLSLPVLYKPFRLAELQQRARDVILAAELVA
ncbi:MAG: two-component system response regulator [Phycisphaerae bacterium]